MLHCLVSPNCGALRCWWGGSPGWLGGTGNACLDEEGSNFAGRGKAGLDSSLDPFPCSLDGLLAVDFPAGEGALYSESITRILDKLLDGYDNRLRPGFGGRGNPGTFSSTLSLFLTRLDKELGVKCK